MCINSATEPVIGKRLWNILRIAFFMMRKGLISKRKLLMDMNLMMKRGKLLRKSLSNLIFHHHYHSPYHNSRRRSPPSPRGFDGFRFRLHDYEFSCSNSPNPVFFHVGKRKHHYYLNFPCIKNPPTDQDEESDASHSREDMEVLAVLPNNNNHKKLPHDTCSPEPGCPHSYNFRLNAPTPDLAPGDPVLLSPLLLSPFSIRISNYSSEEENDAGREGNSRVDDEAEEFIRRFYEQLRMQSRTQLLQYEEEMQYQEMLARGSR
ncbi:uncharacterized protein LOC122078126 [Macadamia integrifolia]|uniref:uncharacterized protein LOC122078126 n=1 Tax=Macadamia integrifolia TaxID=60698 RepID=UPI001C4E9A48|nr:uncharacterized protein LOC122078126 [Macadamia integrifolia]